MPLDSERFEAKDFSTLEKLKEDLLLIDKLVKEYNKTYSLNFSEFNVIDNINRIFQSFKSIKHYKKTFVLEAYKTSKNSYLCLVINNYILQNVHVIDANNNAVIKYSEETDFEFVAFIGLKKDFGEVFIRKETLRDKINELISPIETDFIENNEFSKKFYVLGNSEEKLRANVDKKFFDAFLSHPEIEVEINGEFMMARFRKNFSKETGEQLLDFMSHF